MMKIIVFAFLILFVLSACEENSEVEPSMWVDRDAMDSPLYFESFEYEMVKLRYMDERGESYTFSLEEDMIVGDLELRQGPNQLKVQYRDVVASFEISLGIEPTKRVDFVFNGIDTLRGNMFFSKTEILDVPLSQSMCSVPDYTPPKREHYMFSHFEPLVDNEVPCDGTHTFTLHYEPNVYEVNFYDHEGELIETVEVLYNDSVTNYHHPFPYYMHFNGWNKDLNYISESIDVHPNIVWLEHFVMYHDYEGEVVGFEHVKHGQAASPPTLPEKDGYVFSHWDQSLEDVREPLDVYPVYERLMNVSEPIEEAKTLNNYTISVAWMNVPYGDGHLTHDFKVNGNHVSIDYFGEFYLVKDLGETYIIDTHDFDNHQNWYKSEYTGDDIVGLLGADILAINESMLDYAVTYYTLNSNYFEAIFGMDFEAVIRVEVYSVDEITYFNVEWQNDVFSKYSLYHIGNTNVKIPEYIDES